LGKFLGVQLIIIVNLMLMTALFFGALYIKEQVFPTLLLWSGLLTYFQFLIVSAFTFAISCTSTSSVLPTIFGLFFYIGGNLTEYLNGVATRSGTSDEFIHVMIGKLATGLYAILPNLRNFDLRTQILNLPLNDPPTDVMIPNLIVYGLVYAMSGYLLAMILFFRREL
jgi:ABC-type transport system involved in multi-copper enzyme maturation permease subunit